MPPRRARRRPASTARKNASSLAGSLRPARPRCRSRVSTANGRAAAIASPDVVRREPAREDHRRRARMQAGELPVEASPRCRRRAPASGRRAGGSRRGTRERRAPGRRRAPAPPSSPCSRCGGRPRGSRRAPRRRGAGAASSGTRRPVAATSSSGRVHEHAGDARRAGWSSAPISSASSGAQARGLLRPEDQPDRPGAEIDGPASVAEVVMPQTLTRVIAVNGRRPDAAVYGSGKGSPPSVVLLGLLRLRARRRATRDARRARPWPSSGRRRGSTRSRSRRPGLLSAIASATSSELR